MRSSGLRVPPWRAPGKAGALPWVAALIAAATVAVGLAIQASSSDGLVKRLPPAQSWSIGAPLPPFLMNWDPRLQWTALLGALVAGTVAGIAPALVQRLRSRWGFAALAYLGAATVGLSSNAARGGSSGWTRSFDLGPGGSANARREYLPALPQLAHGIKHYVSHFPQLLPYLPTHVKGNPPGPLVAMNLLGITTPARLAAVCIGLGALTAPFAYALGRTLGGEPRGRIAAMLTAFSPALLLFGVTSVDYAYAGLASAIAWLLVRPGVRGRAAGCALAALASFFSWLLLAIPVWAVLVVARRQGLRTAGIVAAGVLAAVVAFNLLLAATLGYDPIAVLRRLGPIYAAGIAAQRPYLYWLFGSPVAWLVMLGLPTAWIALRALSRGETAALALAAIVLVASLAGFTKAETERIWMPFVPLACVAGASQLSLNHLRVVLLALAAQALVIELLFNTVW